MSSHVNFPHDSMKILKYRVVRNELLSLAALRDTLLSKFISGGLRVKDATRIEEKTL